MPTEIVAALLALLGTAIGTLGGIVASSRLTTYKIDQLTRQVDNRLAAWVIGARDFRKALLIALLEPRDAAEAEKKLDYTARLAAQEAARTLPWGAVWQEFLDRSGVPDDFQVLQVLRDYEKRILSRRN